MADKELDFAIIPHDEQLPETQKSIPASLLEEYEKLSGEDQKKFESHLDNLKSKSEEYSKLNENTDVRMACIKEIASVAKAFIFDFINVPYGEILSYSSSFVNRIQQNEFHELILKEWLQLYIDDAVRKEKKEEVKVEKTQEGIVDGISKVFARGFRGIKTPKLS